MFQISYKLYWVLILYRLKESATTHTKNCQECPKKSHDIFRGEYLIVS